MDLSEAGYGDLGRSYTYGPDLRRALREFESDQGLPVDGIPDDEVREALSTFVERLRNPSTDIPAPDDR